MHILSFFNPHDEFQVALVCKEWHGIVAQRRIRRKQKRWITWIHVFCNTIPRVQFAMDHLALPAKETTAGAVQAGSMEVLRYLHEKGCPWDKRTCESDGDSQVPPRERLPMALADMRERCWRRAP